MKETTKPCEHCGEAFQPVDDEQETCSYDCRMGRKKAIVLSDNRKAAERALRDCEQCAGSMAGKRSHAKFCSGRCKDLARGARRREATKANPKPSGASERRPKARKYTVGQRWGSLVLVEYVGTAKGGTQARFMCDCGHETEKRISNVVSASAPTPTRTCADHCHPDPRPAGDSVTCGARHAQLVKMYGSAKTLACEICKEVTPGNQWAYRHSSDEARCRLTGKDRGQIYSLNDADYWVLCRSHHQCGDRAHKRLMKPFPVGTLSLIHVALAAAFEPDHL